MDKKPFTITSLVAIQGKKITIARDYGRDNLITNAYMRVIDTEEKEVKRALIKLGWTPPPRLRWYNRFIKALYLKEE